MSETQHSPLPWAWLSDEGQFIVDAKRNIVAEVPCQGCNPTDGALLVHRVNRWDELVEALREILNSGVEFDDIRLNHLSIQVHRDAWEQAKKVVADAALHAAEQG